MEKYINDTILAKCSLYFLKRNIVVVVVLKYRYYDDVAEEEVDKRATNPEAAAVDIT